MLFRFSKRGWLGVHLGMTGGLRTETASFRPGKHDHLLLFQKRRTLVFSDPRQFGRILFYRGSGVPSWWKHLPPGITSSSFTVAGLEAALQRHRKAPIKAVLLNQARFPGIGNWMADEILWRGGIHPRTAAGRFDARAAKSLWKEIRFVARSALEIVGRDFSDPPRSWLFHQRWDGKGTCPKHRKPLARETVGGRTTVWCSRCQPVQAATR
jgi:formamidopyrimidine-DNA glycosylase